MTWGTHHGRLPFLIGFEMYGANEDAAHAGVRRVM